MAGIQIDGVNNKIDFDDDLDTSISANTDDTLQVEVGGASVATLTASTIVFNEASADVDFRVESNANTHMLFVDGGDNRVGIKSAPDLGGALHIKVSDSGGTVNGNYDTLVIEESGHSGIAILSGTSSAGLIGFGDSGAALRGYFSYNHSNDSFEFGTAGAERMRIDGSGLIGMGNTTASSFNSGANKLVVGSGSGNNGLTIYAATNSSSSIYFADGTSGDAAYRGYIQYNHSSDALIIATSATQVVSFHTDGVVFNENSNDQNFRVESNGNANMLFVDAGTDKVLIGTNSPQPSGSPGALTVADGLGLMSTDGNSYRKISAASTAALNFYHANNNASLNASGAWTDASDENLKKDIEDISYGTAILKQLKPRKYKMKADDASQIGFIAQEVETLIPEVVEDIELEDGSVQKGLSYGHLTAVLTKTIQELEARITALENN